MADVKNNCSLIGRGEYNINLILLSVSILYSLTGKEKNTATIDFPGRKSIAK